MAITAIVMGKWLQRNHLKGWGPIPLIFVNFYDFPHPVQLKRGLEFRFLGPETAAGWG